MDAASVVREVTQRAIAKRRLSHFRPFANLSEPIGASESHTQTLLSDLFILLLSFNQFRFFTVTVNDLTRA